MKRGRYYSHEAYLRWVCLLFQIMFLFNFPAKYSHNGENIIISVLRVVCVIPTREIKFFEITPKDYWLNLHVKKGDSVHILVFHVFSIRKCISMNHKGKLCFLNKD